MYKCSECGLKYKEKPAYCECGNDIFIECGNKPKENKPRKTRTLKDMFSIIYLIICIILSFTILFFVGNPKGEIQQPKENKIIKKLPDIDTLWKDDKPKQQIETKAKTVAEEVKNNNIEKNTKSLFVNSDKTKVQTLKQNSIKSQPPALKPQIVSQQKQQQPIVKPQQISIQQSQQNIKQQQQVNPKSQGQNQNIQTAPMHVSSEELKQYKKALRNKIVSAIDFLNIAGDGKCVLSFSISSTGVLLNKKFINQSQNSSLNDAVYQAMLNINTYKIPPSNYKSETLKLTVIVSGGNFEVSLE